MKIKLDENLTAGFAPILKKLGHDVQTTINQAAIISGVTDLFSNENTGAWRRCFVAATEHKVPVLRP
jgi:hypothetical protein